MELSPEQESLAMSLRGTFVAKMRDIYEERGTLNRAFQVAMGYDTQIIVQFDWVYAIYQRD